MISTLHHLKKYLLLGTCLLFTAGLFAQLSLSNAVCESEPGFSGANGDSLRLGWEVQSARNGAYTTAYQIVLAGSSQQMAQGGVYRSPKISTRNSQQVNLFAPWLRPGTQYYWKIRVWDDRDQPSAWTRPQHFITGISGSAGWQNAKWISLEKMPDSLRIVPGREASGVPVLPGQTMKRSVVPQFSRNFTVEKKIRTALLFVTGVGQYKAQINDLSVGTAFLAPGWTFYEKTVLYNRFDVTNLLRPGSNHFTATVGNGFYNIGRERYHKFFDAFGYPAFLCRLKVEFEDGSVMNLVSDSSWSVKPSPVIFSSIYGGEDYDARREDDSSGGRSAVEVPAPTNNIVAETDYPVQVMDSFSMKTVATRGPGRYLYDFGQNASGIVRLKVKGKAGAIIRLTPGELLTKEGEINQKASGYPYYFEYTCKGGEQEIWQPAFTYYGFRYVMVEGAAPATETTSDSLPLIQELAALHTRNSAPETGEFSCSNELMNRTYRLIQWAIKSNLQSVVTDCPHREKLGWLEEDYLMGSSLHYNFDIYHLYRKLIKDMIDAQDSSGLVPDIVPEFVRFSGAFRDSPEWGSSSVILPWLVYKWYGDAGILKEAYPMMRRYLLYLESRSSNHLLHHGLGDWYDYGPDPPGIPQLTPVSLTASALFFYDAGLLSRVAGLVGEQADAVRFTQLAAGIRKSINDSLFDPVKNLYARGSQTAMAMPLSLGIVEEKYRGAVLQNLVDSIRANKKALTSGDIGFHFLVDALDKGGQSQLLYEMNNRDDVPGYGFQLRKGATALTESWPALEEVSNNHFMLGHLMEWLFTGLLGIDEDSASIAGRVLRIRPQPVGDMTYARGRFYSPCGWVGVSWQRTDAEFRLDLTVPVNASAKVYLPLAAGRTVFQNGKRTGAVVRTGNEGMLQVTSGHYLFIVK